MTLFTSRREKQYWQYTGLVLLAILSTLMFGHPLLGIFGSQNVQAVIFVLGMLLTGTTILIYGLKTRPGRTEVVIWIGFAAVYLMLFLRLGLPERSHLMEYSVLAIFIHLALVERAKQGKKVPAPALLAFGLTLLTGVLDEGVQYFLPDRVFDPYDIMFNAFAAFAAIGSGMLLRWIRRKMSRSA